MNKTIVIIGALAGLGLGAWYLLVPPTIDVRKLDQLNKKVTFQYGGKEYIFSWTNPALGMTMSSRGFSTTVKMIEGSSPTLVWTTSKSGDIVSMKSIDLNHPQLS